MQNEKNKIRRGEILRALYRNLPHPICDNVFSEVFTEDTPSYVITQLKYLEQKKYIKLENVDEEFSTATCVAKILPAGVDLLEGSIPSDPGITRPKI